MLLYAVVCSCMQLNAVVCSCTVFTAVFTVCIHRPAVFTVSTVVFTVWHTQALLYVTDHIRCIPAVFAVYPPSDLYYENEHQSSLALFLPKQRDNFCVGYRTSYQQENINVLS